MRAHRVVALTAAASLAAPLLLLAGRIDAQSQPSGDPRPHFTGRFRYAGGDAERATVEAAVERTVQSLTAIARPFARPRLRRASAIHEWVEFAFPTHAIEFTEAGQAPVRSPDDGSEITGRGYDGDALRITQRFVGSDLVHHAWSDRGGAEERFALASGDGSTLAMTMHISSSQLPLPVHYTITYRR